MLRTRVFCSTTGRKAANSRNAEKSTVTILAHTVPAALSISEYRVCSRRARSRTQNTSAACTSSCARTGNRRSFFETETICAGMSTSFPTGAIRARKKRICLDLSFISASFCWDLKGMRAAP